MKKLRRRIGKAVCYATIRLQEDGDEMEAQAMEYARRLWPSGQLDVIGIRHCSPEWVQYLIARVK